MENSAVWTRSLRYSYGRQAAVRGVNLEVPRGSIYGFLGPNGAGKTSIIRLLLGQLRPDAGEIKLFGEPLAASLPAILGRVGALVERASCYPQLSALDNIEIIRRMRGLPRHESDRALAIAGLTEEAGRPVKTFSLGMRQRLGLAQAMLGQPELLILDEPSNGLDPVGMREMRELIRSLPSRWGVTVFMSSHILSEIEQVATHLCLIKEGLLVFQGKVERLEQDVPGNTLEDRYLSLMTAEA